MASSITYPCTGFLISCFPGLYLTPAPNKRQSPKSSAYSSTFWGNPHYDIDLQSLNRSHEKQKTCI